MMNNSFEEDEGRSASLPSPEAARAHAAMMLKNASSSTIDSSVDDSNSFRMSNNDGSDLPSVEEARMNAPIRSLSFKKKTIGIVAISLILIIGIIATAVSVAPQQGGGEESDLEFGGDLGSFPVLTGTEDSPHDKPKFSANLRTPSPSPAPTANSQPQETPLPVMIPTPAPEKPSATDSPTLSRYDQILKALISQGVSSEVDLARVDSPQRKALEWIVEEDLPSSSSTENVAKLVQRYVLAVLFFEVGNIMWRLKLNFLKSSLDECDWFTTFTSYGTKQMGVTCNEDGMVNALNLPKNFLAGTFPKELIKLADLERLDVFDNKKLTGGFPDFFQAMPKLNFIGLHYCGLTGSLPAWLGDLTSLKSLVLSNNAFQGDLPSSMKKLTNLEDLYLDDNQFQGGIGALGDMTSLRNLVLEDNQFTGSLDYDTVEGWKNLETLDASHNQFQSSLPSNLFRIPNLRIVDLHECQLLGSIPEIDSALTALELLTLNSNNLSGEIPGILGESTLLRHIDLTGNKFSSTIPASFGNLEKLEVLYLGQNSFDPAPIPSSFYNLKTLKQVSFKNTNRKGGIPAWIGDLSSLTMLDLDGNDLTGPIPTSLGDLSNMEYLLLQRNNLEGTIPSQLSGLSKLSYFVADKNRLTGSADPVCDLPNSSNMFASADCRGSDPEVTCSCCNICCADGDASCNDQVWLADSNPMWELDYKRVVAVEFDAAAQRSYDVIFNGSIP